MERISLAAGDLRLELAPRVGGAIAAFCIVRNEAVIPLMRPSRGGLDDALDSACFPLVPFVNRVRDGRFTFDGREVKLAPNLPGQKHPLHGDGWRAPWTVAHAGPLSAELAFDHAPAAWPWRYEARQRFDLDADGLWIRLTCRNTSDGPMPCGLGLHPYFPCDADTVLDTRVEAVWTIDHEIMPVARQPAVGRYALIGRRICGADLDNGYAGWGGEAVVSWPRQGVTLAISAPGAEWFQVYAPAEGGLFVAEPVSHENAALNLPRARWAQAGLKILQPGEMAQLAVRFDVR